MRFLCIKFLLTPYNHVFKHICLYFTLQNGMIVTVREEIMKKKIILLVAVTTLLCGCGKTIPKLENGQEAVVTFSDGSKISVDDLYNKLKADSTNAIIDMIDTKILEEKYKDDLDSAKDYAENYINSLKNYYVDDKGQYDEAKLVSAINQYYGYSSIAEFQESVRINYLRNKAIEDYTESTIKDKDIEKYYKDEVVPNREVSHILIVPETKDSMTDDEKKNAEEAALNEAKSIIAKLKKGEKFEDLAKEYSDDEATKEKGGSLGEINKGTYGSDDFDKEVYDLKVGSYSNTPVKTSKGYEIVYVTAEKEKKSLEDAKKEIIDAIREDKLEKDATLQVTAMTELRKEHGVDIVDSEINKNYKEYVEALEKSARNQNAAN